MEFYEKKLKAQELIKLALQKNKSITKAKLYFIITDTYGFGQTFVDKYISLMKDVGMVTIKEDEVILK